MSPTRPIIRYYGGKWKLAPWVISHFPPHKVYVEPYGGAASVLLQKPRVPTEVYNDLYSEVVSLFRTLRDPDARSRRAEKIKLTPWAREEYQSLYAASDDPIERARCFIARSFMGMSSKGAMRRSGFDRRINDDGFIARINSFRAVPEQLDLVAERMARVVIESMPALEVLRAYDRDDALFFVDPPYLDAGEQVYKHRATAEDHAELLAQLRELTGFVILSGYRSAVYDDALPDWCRVETQAITDGAYARVECLWINPAACAALDAQRMPLFAEARA